MRFPFRNNNRESLSKGKLRFHRELPVSVSIAVISFDWPTTTQSSETANPYTRPLNGNDQRCVKGKFSFLISKCSGLGVQAVSKEISSKRLVNVCFIQFLCGSYKLRCPVSVQKLIII